MAGSRAHANLDVNVAFRADDQRSLRQSSAARRQGVDIGLVWRLHGTDLGDFDLNIDAAYLDQFERGGPPQVAELFAARNAGAMKAATPLTDAGDLRRQNGKPDWKVSAALTWRKGPVHIGAVPRSPERQSRVSGAAPRSAFGAALPNRAWPSQLSRSALGERGGGEDESKCYTGCVSQRLSPSAKLKAP